MICYWYLYSYKKFILFVTFTYFANKYCKSNKYYGKNMFINIKKHLHRNEKSFIFANVILNTIFLP